MPSSILKEWLTSRIKPPDYFAPYAPDEERFFGASKGALTLPVVSPSLEATRSLSASLVSGGVPAKLTPLRGCRRGSFVAPWICTALLAEGICALPPFANVHVSVSARFGPAGGCTAPPALVGGDADVLNLLPSRFQSPYGFGDRVPELLHHSEPAVGITPPRPSPAKEARLRYDFSVSFLLSILSSILERPKLGVAAPLEPDIVEPGLTAILALSSGFSLRSVGYLHQKLSSDPGVKWMKRLAIHARCCACYLGHSRSTQVLEQVRSSNSNALLLDWDDLSQREQMSLFVAVSAVSQCEGAAASDRKAALRIVKARSRQSWTRTVWCASQQPGAPSLSLGPLTLHLRISLWRLPCFCSRSVRHMRKRMQHARFVRRFLLGCAWPSTIVRSILPRTVRTCTVALICPFILLQLAPFHLGPFIIRSVPCASNSKADLLCRLLRLRPLLLCQLLLVELDLLLVPGDGGGLLDIELSVVRFLPLCSRVSWPCEKFFFSLVALLVLGSSVTGV
ncbi:hypothetical protein KC365_g44 [Hortaea werneckii]|nr:hypothetical protein KC365_g44 [Hortaea werneckii]